MNGYWLKVNAFVNFFVERISCFCCDHFDVFALMKKNAVFYDAYDDDDDRMRILRKNTSQSCKNLRN